MNFAAKILVHRSPASGMSSRAGKRIRTLTVMLALLLMTVFLAPVSVQAQQSASPNGVSSREQAAKAAIRLHGEGKVLGVRKKTRADGSAYFEVKILTNGQVSIYEIDA